MCYRYTTGQSLSVSWRVDDDPRPPVHKLIAPSDERVAAAASQPRPERSAAKRNAHYPTAVSAVGYTPEAATGSDSKLLSNPSGSL